MFIKPEFLPRSLDYNEYTHWEIGRNSLGGLTILSFTLFAGEVDPDLARGAWSHLCSQHPMLGATIAESKEGCRFVPLEQFPELEVVNTSSEDLIEYGLGIVHHTDFTPGRFLFRSFAILNAGLGRHLFLLVASHAAADGAACLTLHKDFFQALNDPRPTCASTQLRTLPPSLPSMLLGAPKRARFFVNGALDQIRYDLLRDFIPFDRPTLIEKRSTSRLIALLDPLSTQSLLDQASREYGLTAYLAARLIRAGYMHMRELGLFGSNANLGLYVPVDLRPFFGAKMHKNVSMSTVLESANLRIGDRQDSREIARAIHQKMEVMVRRKSIRRHLLNWYSPSLMRRGVIAMLNRNRHFGLGSTHIGRFNAGARGKVRILATHGFTEATHGLYLMGGTTQIIRKRLLVTMAYCTPVVSETTARQVFEKFLVSIGASASQPIMQSYDNVVSELVGPEA